MCVNKAFVHSGSIGLILGKHARYVIMYVLAEFSSMTFFLNVFVAGSVVSHITKHVSKAGKVEPGDRVTLPVKIACKPDPLARVTLAQGDPLSL